MQTNCLQGTSICSTKPVDRDKLSGGLLTNIFPQTNCLHGKSICSTKPVDADKLSAGHIYMFHQTCGCRQTVCWAAYKDFPTDKPSVQTKQIREPSGEILLLEFSFDMSVRLFICRSYKMICHRSRQ